VGGKGSEFDGGALDIRPLAERTSDLKAEPPKDSPEHYLRPHKTVLVRTVRDGGTGYYIRGDHRATLPALHGLLVERMGG
jgi:hypothetical protein